jgi:hypothetical protein
MRNRRRTRYRFIATPPRSAVAERIDVLGYSREAALTLLARKGWTNPRPAPEPPKPRGSWRPDHAAIREAIEFLGISHPVKIKQTSRQGGRYGAHELRRDAGGKVYSHITVKSWLDAREAGRTLWHELAHAMQASRAIDANPDRDPLVAWGAVRAKGKGVPYRAKPIEVEARSYESFNDETPLAF